MQRITSLLVLALASACTLLPDGSRALSLEEAVAVLQGAADDVGRADLNGDGLLQIDSNSGVPLEALQNYLRSNAAELLDSDSNGDGMLDNRELLSAAPTLASGLYAARESMGEQDADGELIELGYLAYYLIRRVSQALKPL